MSRRTKWYRGVRTLSAKLRCAGGVHTITWRRGRLILRDHDVEGEMGLAALGGEPPECLKLYHAWTTARSSAEALRFIARKGELPLEAVVVANLQNLRRASAVAQFAIQQPGTHTRVSAELRSAEMLSVLLQLPEEMRSRLDAEMTVHLWRNPGQGHEEMALRRGALTTSLSQKANPALESSMRSWRRMDAAAALTVETWPADDDEPSIMGWLSARGGVAAASLPFTWIVKVWARDLAEVDGCFVLDVLDAGERSLRVLAVRWERRFAEEMPPSTDRHETARWAHLRDRYTPVVGEAFAARDRRGRWRLRWL